MTYTKHKKKYAPEPAMRKIYIHKNYLKQYFDMKWEDVPEFCEFLEVPEGWVQIK